MLGIYHGKFTQWTEENEKNLTEALRICHKGVVVLLTDTPEGEPYFEKWKDVADKDKVYFYATAKSFKDYDMSQGYVVEEEPNLLPDIEIVGFDQGVFVYKGIVHKDPNLKDYNSWFKKKTFTGKIHNTDFSKPMASYDYSNNVSQNGTKGYINHEQGIVSLENGDNKIYMSSGDLQFLAMEASFFDTQIQKQEMPDSICCNFMASHLKQGQCEQHGANCPDLAFTFIHGKWTLKAQNGNYQMFHCPWCGTKLPNTEEEFYKEVKKN